MRNRNSSNLFPSHQERPQQRLKYHFQEGSGGPKNAISIIDSESKKAGSKSNAYRMKRAEHALHLIFSSRNHCFSYRVWQKNFVCRNRLGNRSRFLFLQLARSGRQVWVCGVPSVPFKQVLPPVFGATRLKLSVAACTSDAARPTFGRWVRPRPGVPGYCIIHPSDGGVNSGCGFTKIVENGFGPKARICSKCKRCEQISQRSGQNWNIPVPPASMSLFIR